MGPRNSKLPSLDHNHNQTSMTAGQGEDDAETIWPVVVKVKANVPADQLAQHLEDMAVQVRDGFFVQVDENGSDDVWPGDLRRAAAV